MTVELLLRQVSAINKKYEDIAEVTGERFNIFKILKVESNEVRMHSALLAEFLNPNGSHGQKGTFLKAFIDTFHIKNFDSSDIENSQVVVEEHIDKINEDYTMGGRIDIVIKSGTGKAIIIENKIYASDGHNQLVRYKNAYPNAHLFYLTLTGTLPSRNSVGNLNEDDYKCISYSSDIIRWLEKCREKSVMLPMLRECISQYIYLLKHLTHQSTNKIQEMEIQKLLLASSENFESAETIAAAIQKVKDIVLICKDELFDLWERKYGSREVEIFKANDFIFYIKPSFEQKYFHFDLYPLKNNSMGWANEQELSDFRVLAQKFDARDKNLFWYNNNYTIWVCSKFDLTNIEYEQCKKLNTDRAEWLSNAMNEGKAFIEYIVNGLKKMNNPEIIINPDFF